MVVTVHTASTDALDKSLIKAIRTLLDEAFHGAFTEDDWVHAIGGRHVWITADGRLVSHGSVVERTLSCAGVPMQVGYVEAVATLTAYRHQGYGARVMHRIGELIRGQYPLGALSTGTHAFYDKLGWERWRGFTFVDGPKGRQRTPGDDGDVMVLRTPRSALLDLDADITCDWRSGDVW